ncbi:hypothetical protein K0M31_011635 [Melipona bicolor]|uniref:Uncharacterized protein n=1 Tax=Melipona bicolor TaxID=60889 RepID=A0AA40KV73_9HYME|nr:hypothetical protein K0M31_011635 [Melipona bicolor]
MEPNGAKKRREKGKQDPGEEKPKWEKQSGASASERTVNSFSMKLREKEREREIGEKPTGAIKSSREKSSPGLPVALSR